MANKSTTVKLTLKITSFILRLLLNTIFYILVVIMIINFSKMAYQFTYQLYGPVAVDSKANANRVILQIKKGESTMDIAKKLETLRAIKNKYSFYMKVKLQNDVIMPGTYELFTDMTYNEILAVITDYSASIIKDEDTGGTKGSTTGTPTVSPTVSPTGSGAGAATGG